MEGIVAFKLTTSVGQGETNTNAADNVWVQLMLNKFIVPGALGNLKPLAPDGIVGSRTIAAIKKFQANVVGFERPDGRVDPGGKTEVALNGPLKWPAFAWRSRPPSIQQGPLECWAAAISSFSRAVFGIKDFSTIADVQAEFRSFAPGEILPDGSLSTPSGWIEFANRFGLNIVEIRIIDPTAGRAGPATSGIISSAVDDLEAGHFTPKLRRSHVIVVKGTRRASGLSHTVVVYGADRFRLCFMDPLRDPTIPTRGSGAIPLRPPGGSGRAGANWFCQTYDEFVGSVPRFLLIWK
jgi:hypothetical protein